MVQKCACTSCGWKRRSRYLQSGTASGRENAAGRAALLYVRRLAGAPFPLGRIPPARGPKGWWRPSPKRTLNVFLSLVLSLGTEKQKFKFVKVSRRNSRVSPAQGRERPSLQAESAASGSNLNEWLYLGLTQRCMGTYLQVDRISMNGENLDHSQVPARTAATHTRTHPSYDRSGRLVDLFLCFCCVIVLFPHAEFACALTSLSTLLTFTAANLSIVQKCEQMVMR
jgi:hypothetical protein